MADTSSLLNTARNVIRPGYFGVMSNKALTRISELPRARQVPMALDWSEEHTEDLAAYASSLNPAIWAETEHFVADLNHKSTLILKPLADQGISLGGGGNIALLYFLTRLLAPKIVLESGVAAGFSTQTVLAAMNLNRVGQLYSSDFPYFRLPEPEKYVGILVDNALKDRWSLYLRGDRANLRAILAKSGPIDLFHYDSDKSYRGRNFACKAVWPRLATGYNVVMDDIGDNLFFRDLVHRENQPFRVFGAGRRFVGLLGPIAER